VREGKVGFVSALPNVLVVFCRLAPLLKRHCSVQIVSEIEAVLQL
jgi:hypothetical protein